jgi:hypothetical protein
MTDCTDIADVRRLLDQFKEEIMQRYQAEGVAIGKKHPSDKNYCFVVYLDNKRKIPPEPVIIAGVPVQFEVTGKFKPLSPK